MTIGLNHIKWLYDNNMQENINQSGDDILKCDFMCSNRLVGSLQLPLAFIHETYAHNVTFWYENICTQMSLHNLIRAILNPI